MKRKKTKLTEKATRVSNIKQLKWEKAIGAYLKEVEQLNKESARSHRFAMLLQELLGVDPDFIEDYCSGIEQYIKAKEKDRILKGEADNLFGNVVIEFENNLPKKRTESESQLRRYAAILWSREAVEAHTPYLCIATDGVRFISYSPKLDDPTAKEIKPDMVTLEVLEESDWKKLKPHEVFFWLDRYFLRQEKLHPTTESIVKDFGLKSHAFQNTSNALLSVWEQIKDRSNFKVIYDSWDKYLRIVYGSKVGGDELFVRHTYLATLAKLMSWMRISESDTLPEDEQILEMLEGQLFKRQGIENFIEEDFFSWLARDEAAKTGIATVRLLFSLLQNYRLRELSEDVLKSLYQELVDPATRHDLGEFYTPDWLAHRMVNKLLDSNPQGSVLDPACGSGTFLYLTIREKIDRLGRYKKTLRHVLNSVCGIDIHPLAVIVAKTNYILALGDLLKKREGSVSIPIYLADSIKLPEIEKETEMVEIEGKLIQRLPGYRIDLNGTEVTLPERLTDDISLYDHAIELAKEFAQQNKGKSTSLEGFTNFLSAQRFPKVNDRDLTQSIYLISEMLKKFIDSNRDTIWAFILKNIYKPLFFRRDFDLVIGNPPWISFRYMEPYYQGVLKKKIVNEYRLLTGRAENISNLEIATLFLLRATDLYLRKLGQIAFVLPRSVFSADQHDGFRRRTSIFLEHPGQNLFWCEVWDCEKVAPLFNVPACVLFAQKRDNDKIEYPVAGQILSARFERKNASLKDTKENLLTESVEFMLHTRGKRTFWGTGKATIDKGPSYYKKRFMRGADIHPRSFWFVQIKASAMGFNPDLPPLETSERATREAMATWKSVFIKDTVESRFLYGTLISTDLLPFAHLDFRPIVVPIQSVGNHYELIDPHEANQRGFVHLAGWLKKAEREWNTRRSAKAEQISLLEWLDYRGKLTIQNPQSRYRVIYNTSGTYLTAAVVENKPIQLVVDRQVVQLSGFVADTKTYYRETNHALEASYLVAILNAPFIDELIKPMQSRGLWGPRDIHKKVFELPIPQFTARHPDHQRLAELGKECAKKVKKWLASGGQGNVKSIGRLRGMVREMLKEELKQIDKIVKKILK
jgi:hypothetical protein